MPAFRPEWRDPETGRYYTKAQYELIANLKTEGYEDLSIAEFNRTIYAALNDGTDEQETMALLHAFYGLLVGEALGLLSVQPCLHSVQNGLKEGVPLPNGQIVLDYEGGFYGIREDGTGAVTQGAWS